MDSETWMEIRVQLLISQLFIESKKWRKKIGFGTRRPIMLYSRERTGEASNRRHMHMPRFCLEPCKWETQPHPSTHPPSFPLIKPVMSFTPVLCFWCFPRNQHQSAQTMGRVRELEKGHVGFWTQKCCIKRIVGKSALEQRGLSCYIAERERERHLKGDTAISTWQIIIKEKIIILLMSTG